MAKLWTNLKKKNAVKCQLFLHMIAVTYIFSIKLAKQLCNFKILPLKELLPEIKTKLISFLSLYVMHKIITTFCYFTRKSSFQNWL